MSFPEPAQPAGPTCTPIMGTTSIHSKFSGAEAEFVGGESDEPQKVQDDGQQHHQDTGEEEIVVVDEGETEPVTMGLSTPSCRRSLNKKLKVERIVNFREIFIPI